MAKDQQEKRKLIDHIFSADLADFRRTQLFEDAKTTIQIFLMITLAAALFVFLSLTIIAGVFTVLPDTEGTKALSKLFVDITLNAKAVGLVCFGFFFREYLSARKLG